MHDNGVALSVQVFAHNPHALQLYVASEVL